MNCLNCGQEVGSEVTCPYCGYDLGVQIKALKLSNMYYNQGLDKAQIRDLSGAIDMLERSLKFNKRNIDSRNLLGLVYFETGEVVAALSEWVISKNMKPENNIASEYIDKLQANQNRLDVIQQTIRRYNRALDACRAGEEDVSVVMLRKVVAANPKLMKAYYLLALLYMKKGEYEKARKVLKRALPIDRTNATALRFLREIDEKRGTVTDLEGLSKGIVREERKGIFKLIDLIKKDRGDYRINNGYMATGWDEEETIINAPVVQPIAFHQVPAFAGIMNIIIGILLGAFVVGLIVLPAVKQSINRNAEEKINQYSSAMVTQNEHIKELEDKILDYNDQIDSGNTQISQASETISSYEALLNAYISYESESYDKCREYLESVNTDQLSDDAKNIYNSVLSDINSKQYDSYYASGLTAFQKGEYSTAISYFTAAKNVNSDSYSAMAYLAHCYRLNDQSSEAISAFQDIAKKYPGSQRAATAEKYITLIQTGNMSPEVGVAQVNSEIAAGEMEEVDTTEESS